MALAPIAALGVAACGSSSNSFDIQKLEHDIASRIEAYSGTRLTASCPGAGPIDVGQSTTCTVTAPDGTSTTVRVTHLTGGRLQFHTQSLMPTASVERGIAQSMSRKLGFAVTVRCPDLVLASPRLVVHCKATDPKGLTKTVIVTPGASGFSYIVG